MDPRAVHKASTACITRTAGRPADECACNHCVSWVSCQFGRNKVAESALHGAERRSSVSNHDRAHAAGKNWPGHSRRRWHCHRRRRRRLPPAVPHGGGLRLLQRLLRHQRVRTSVHVSICTSTRVPAATAMMRSAARDPARPCVHIHLTMMVGAVEREWMPLRHILC